ncbi:MAG: hypothetical protein V3W18_00850 [candidate division Zixibacteria bacterium]
MNFGLSKSYPLDPETVEKAIKMRAAGNFALGEIGETGSFVVEYVGRSGSDVKRKIKAMLGRQYSAFRYCYAMTPKDAFEKDCRIFHDLGGSIMLDNTEHPTRPERVKWQCPLCDIY